VADHLSDSFIVQLSFFGIDVMDIILNYIDFYSVFLSSLIFSHIRKDVLNEKHFCGKIFLEMKV